MPLPNANEILTMLENLKSEGKSTLPPILFDRLNEALNNLSEELIRKAKNNQPVDSENFKFYTERALKRINLAYSSYLLNHPDQAASLPPIDPISTYLKGLLSESKLTQDAAGVNPNPNRRETMFSTGKILQAQQVQNKNPATRPKLNNATEGENLTKEDANKLLGELKRIASSTPEFSPNSRKFNSKKASEIALQNKSEQFYNKNKAILLESISNLRIETLQNPAQRRLALHDISESIGYMDNALSGFAKTRTDMARASLNQITPSITFNTMGVVEKHFAETLEKLNSPERFLDFKKAYETLKKQLLNADTLSSLQKTSKGSKVYHDGKPYKLSRTLAEIITILSSTDNSNHLEEIGFKVKRWLEKEAARRTGDKALKGLTADKIATALLSSTNSGVEPQHKVYAAIYQLVSQTHNHHLKNPNTPMDKSAMDALSKKLEDVVQASKNAYTSRSPEVKEKRNWNPFRR